MRQYTTDNLGGAKLGYVPLELGKYRVLETMSGGMSSVYLGQDSVSGTTVVIKVIESKLDRQILQSFQKGSFLSEGLRHPNLVNVIESGIAGGKPFAVMEYLKGQSLARLVQLHGPMPVRRALPFFMDIARGIEQIHSRGYLHRDIKPSNVMITERGDKKALAVIIDFDLVRRAGEIDMSPDAEIFGSPLYMSPEQCRGLPLGTASDIYSLGCLMYETLSGVVPLRGATASETFKLKCRTRRVEPLAIPVLGDIVSDCLDLAPEKRPDARRLLKLLAAARPV